MALLRVAIIVLLLALLQPQALALYYYNPLNTSDLATEFRQPDPFLAVGQTIKIVERTSNLGNETAPASSTVVESMPDGARTWLRKPEIARYSHRDDTFNYTCFAKGDFTLVSISDAYLQVNETNESNNKALTAVHCLEPKLASNRPDLASAFSAGRLVLKAGESARVYQETKNKGDAAVGNTSTSLVFGNGTRVLLAEPPLGVLESFKTYFDVLCTEPRQTVIASTADADNRIAEYDEKNNHDLLLVECGSKAPLANLVSSFQSQAVTAFVGGRASLYEKTSNAGGAAATATVTSVRLPDGSIRRFNRPGLEPGAFKSDFVTIECSKQGTLLVESSADYASAVQESDEQDNYASATVKCVDPVYSGDFDLASEFLDGNLTAYVGESVALHERTSNGGGTSPQSKTRVWWAHGIAYYDNPPLAGGGGRQSAYEFACTKSGVFTVSSLADSELALAEYDEENNRATAVVACRELDGSLPSEPAPAVGAIPKIIFEPPNPLPALDLLSSLFEAIANVLSSLGR